MSDRRALHNGEHCAMFEIFVQLLYSHGNQLFSFVQWPSLDFERQLRLLAIGVIESI